LAWLRSWRLLSHWASALRSWQTLSGDFLYRERLPPKLLQQLEEAMTSDPELLVQRRAILRRETERITKRIIKALDTAKLTDKDSLHDYERLHWMIGKALAVHCRKEGKTNNARSIARGIIEAFDEKTNNF
jgi:hypothetical protein